MTIGIWCSRINFEVSRCRRMTLFHSMCGKFTQCHDELDGVSVNVLEEDMVSQTLLGLPKRWNNYQDSVNGRQKLLNWDFL